MYIYIYIYIYIYLFIAASQRLEEDWVATWRKCDYLITIVFLLHPFCLTVSNCLDPSPPVFPVAFNPLQISHSCPIFLSMLTMYVFFGFPLDLLPPCHVSIIRFSFISPPIRAIYSNHFNRFIFNHSFIWNGPNSIIFPSLILFRPVQIEKFFILLIPPFTKFRF